MQQNTPPAFSIITVTKNNLVGLKTTHESLLTQTAQNFEWIVIDDASTDQTTEFLKTTNALWSSDEDAGIYDAMNKGLKKAQGHYLLFLNAGDALATPDILETITKHTEKELDFIYGDALETTSEKNSQPFYKTAKRYNNLPQGMFTHHQAMFYARAHIKENNLRYSLLYTIASDYDFTIRFLKNAKKIVYLPKPVCIFEQGGISQRQAFEGRREQFMIREKLNLVSPPENLWIFIRQSIAWKLRAAFPLLYRFSKARKTDRV